MRKIYNYSIKKEDYWVMLHAKRFNPRLEITFRDRSGQHTYKLSAGYGDVLDVYREGTKTYVLSTNSKFGYIGLEILEGDEKTGAIFLERHQIKEALGKEDMAPFNVIKRLREHII